MYYILRYKSTWRAINRKLRSGAVKFLAIGTRIDRANLLCVANSYTSRYTELFFSWTGRPDRETNPRGSRNGRIHCIRRVRGYACGAIPGKQKLNATGSRCDRSGHRLPGQSRSKSRAHGLMVSVCKTGKRESLKATEGSASLNVSRTGRWSLFLNIAHHATLQERGELRAKKRSKRGWQLWG